MALWRGTHRSWPPALEILAEEAVEFGERDGIGQGVECPGFRDGARRADEAAPGHAGERAADADAPDPEPGEILDGEAERAADQHVDGLRRHRLDDFCDLLARTDPRRIE